MNTPKRHFLLLTRASPQLQPQLQMQPPPQLQLQLQDDKLKRRQHFSVRLQYELWQRDEDEALLYIAYIGCLKTKRKSKNNQNKNYNSRQCEEWQAEARQCKVRQEEPRRASGAEKARATYGKFLINHKSWHPSHPSISLGAFRSAPKLFSMLSMLQQPPTLSPLVSFPICAALLEKFNFRK